MVNKIFDKLDIVVSILYILTRNNHNIIEL